MMRIFDIRKLKVYCWVGLGIVAMCTIHEYAHNHHEGFGQAFLNCLWLTIYLTAVNYLLYEYAVPRFRWRRLYITLPSLFLYLFLLTEGFHGWAELGYVLHLNKDYIELAGKKH